MKYKKIFLSVTILSIITINLTIPSYNSLPTGSLQLSQIAFANDTEGGDGGNDFKKCERLFFPRPWCNSLFILWRLFSSLGISHLRW